MTSALPVLIEKAQYVKQSDVKGAAQDYADSIERLKDQQDDLFSLLKRLVPVCGQTIDQIAGKVDPKLVKALSAYSSGD
jgi:phage tail tape-measure protein